MANIMSMADIKNRPSRNGFDLSSKKNFSAKVGELLPVMSKVVLPGDSFKINLKSFTRTQPLNTSAFARMREYYDFYFVPFEQLWNKFDSVIVQMNENVQHASGPNLDDNVTLSGSLPYLTCQQIADYIWAKSNHETQSNAFGFGRGELSAKLLQYLGYGNFYGYTQNSWDSEPMLHNLNMSVFPLMAYQKIYSDFYRYTQWERTNPSTFNCDYVKGTSDLNLDISSYWDSSDENFFDLRYCNYQKDLFHGVLPQPQFGSGSVALVTGDVLGYGVPSFSPNNGPVSSDEASIVFDGPNGQIQVKNDSSVYTGISWSSPNLRLAQNAGVAILSLRQAEFLQKWKEIAMSGEQDYKSQIQKHWNVSVSDFLSHQSRYLGGCATSLDINEVVNTNITGDNAADIAGKGTFSGNGTIHFESKGEYGIIMCIYHVLPIPDYVTSGVDHSCTLTEATSFPIPELDKVGMELVPLVRLMNPLSGTYENINNSTFVGYAPRYIDWKTDVDRSVGAFTSTLGSWCLPINDKLAISALNTGFPTPSNVDQESIGSGFFKVNPHIVDSLFAVQANSSVDTDQLLCSSFFDIKVVRNLDSDGLPY